MKCAIFVACLSTLTFISCQTPPPDCSGIADGTLFENPDDPRDYYRCQNGIPQPVRCDNNKVFCTLVNACVTVCPSSPTTTTTTTTTTTVSPIVPPNPTMCNGYPNGIIFPLAGSCSGFVMCENDQPKVGYCENDLKFNPVTGICGPAKCP